MVHNEVDVDFAVYSRFAESKYWLHKWLSQADIPSGEPVLIELSRYFKSDGEQGDVVIILNKSLYGQAKSARLWYEKLRNGLLDRGFVLIKVDPFLFMSKTVVGVVYVYDCHFWVRSQSEIDNVMNYFKEDGTS